jgi:hypothetical protein
MAVIMPPYHFGVVVDDVDAAMEELGRVLGLTWGRVQRKHLIIDTPTGPTPTEVCYVYSLDGPPYLEVIERRTGTVFEDVGLHHIAVWCDDPAHESYLEVIERRTGTVFEDVGLHHIAVWCDDPAHESVRLEGEGWPRESVNLTADGAWAGALYHLGTAGLRVEVVDIATSGPRLCRYLDGGDYA